MWDSSYVEVLSESIVYNQLIESLECGVIYMKVFFETLKCGIPAI